DRNVRRAEAFHRVRDACANLKETVLVTERRLYVSFDSQMVFGVVGLFRIDSGLYVRRKMLPPGACKGIQPRRKQIEIIVAWGVRPGPRAGRVVASLESHAVIIEEIERFFFAALSDLRGHSIAGRAKLITSFVESGRRCMAGRTRRSELARKHRHRKHCSASGESRRPGDHKR